MLSCGEETGLCFLNPMWISAFYEKKPQLPQLFYGNTEDDYEMVGWLVGS